MVVSFERKIEVSSIFQNFHKSIAENLIFYSHTKHIEIDVHFFREKMEKNEVEVKYVPTSHQVADVFTKRLPRSRFQFLCDKLSLRLSPVISDSHGSSGKKTSKRESVLRGNGEEHVT